MVLTGLFSFLSGFAFFYWICLRGQERENDEKTLIIENYLSLREGQWKDFIKTCEKFDYVQFKNGCATGYMKHQVSVNPFDGTSILVPHELVKVELE